MMNVVAGVSGTCHTDIKFVGKFNNTVLVFKNNHACSCFSILFLAALLLRRHFKFKLFEEKVKSL